MKTTLVDKTLRLDYLDGILESFVNKKSQTQTHDMVFAILRPFDNGKNTQELQPYRLIYVGTDDEFVSVATFLESIGLQCINRTSGSMNGYDLVFIMPDENLDDLHPERDPNYADKLDAVRALFNR